MAYYAGAVMAYWARSYKRGTIFFADLVTTTRSHSGSTRKSAVMGTTLIRSCSLLSVQVAKKQVDTASPSHITHSARATQAAGITNARCPELQKNITYWDFFQKNRQTLVDLSSRQINCLEIVNSGHINCPTEDQTNGQIKGSFNKWRVHTFHIFWEVP